MKISRISRKNRPSLVSVQSIRLAAVFCHLTSMEALNLKIRFSASATSHATTHFTIAGQKVIIAAGNTRRTVFSSRKLFITSIDKRHAAEASSRKPDAIRRRIRKLTTVCVDEKKPRLAGLCPALPSDDQKASEYCAPRIQMLESYSPITVPRLVNGLAVVWLLLILVFGI